MNSYLAIAFVVCLAVMQVTSQAAPAAGSQPADASTAAAQNARNRMLLQRLSRARTASGPGGLLGGGMNNILPFMLLSGAGGDSMRSLMMLNMFSGAGGAGASAGGAQGGMMGNLLPLMMLSEGGLSF
nr:uncharacterized protein LOC105321169 isoform X1 [Crassostrea gigas]